MSNVFYLKYRPQTLTDLLGQEIVVKTLKSAFDNQRLAHAYLLVGPRGTGKTSTARILAKMVNCLVKQNVPCNKCPTCLSITDGSSLDLMEIDAASHRGIEDIRSLREKIKLAPSQSKKKVYIIDEVHMLTTEAFNALLKTLEEPPDHVLFILATTDVSKIPATILSRVQRLNFKLADPQRLSDLLEKVIKQEKIDIEKEALNLIIKKAEGSFRDGVKLLDQIADYKGKITTSDILESLRSYQFDDLIKLIKNLSLAKVSESLMEISKYVKQGGDVKELTLSLMEALRNIMLINNDLGPQLVQATLEEEKYNQMVDLSKEFTTNQLISHLDILQEALVKLKVASIPSLPLEVVVVEICGNKLSVLSDQLSDNSQSVVSRSVTEEPKTDKPESVLAKSASENRKQKTDNSEPMNLSSPDSPDILKLKEKWTFVLETIRPYNFSLEALLRSVKINRCSDNEVVMEVPYSFHQRILEASKNRDLLEGILSDVLGRQVRVAVVLGTRPQRREDVANVEVAADDEIIRVAAEIFNSESVN